MFIILKGFFFSFFKIFGIKFNLIYSRNTITIINDIILIYNI